jgi:hypothetical protein
MNASTRKEARLRSNIVKRLNAYSGFWFVTHADQYGTGGLPDIIGCYNGRFVGLEVKLPGKEHTLTQRQSHVLAKITAAGGIGAMVTTVDQAMDLVFGSP